MFVTKKRHNVELALRDREIHSLQLDLDDADGDIDVLTAKVAELKKALEFIANQRTTAANATVTRMADRAEEALGRTKPAAFVTDPAKPEGTLADLRRHFFNATSGHVTTPVAKESDLDYTFVYPLYVGDTTNDSVTTPSYSGGGGDFGGGGSSGSWSDSSSSSYDSGSSSSYDSGSCGGDSGGGGGCD